MSSYQNVTPPISLMPGDVAFSFNNEAFPGGALQIKLRARFITSASKPKQRKPVVLRNCPDGQGSEFAAESQFCRPDGTMEVLG
jgi:hypothetical protein